MPYETPLTADRFKVQLREIFQKLAVGSRLIKLPKNSFVYTSGQRDEAVYYIVSGQVKLLVPSPEGKECLLAIRTSGDIFGELCLSGPAVRFETAMAMKGATVRQIFHRDFLAYLKSQSLLEDLVRYLAARIAEQQEIIISMVTLRSEQRLAHTLIGLSRVLGKNMICGTCIEPKMSQLELAKMVGTTRTRIGMFLKRFRELGLIHLTHEGCIVINEIKLKEFLEGYGFPDDNLRGGAPATGAPARQPAPRTPPCGGSCLPARLRF